MGRPSILRLSDKKQIIEKAKEKTRWNQNRYSYKEIAKEFHVSVITIKRVLKNAGIRRNYSYDTFRS